MEKIIDLVTDLIREDRPVRFEFRHMGWTNRYAVSYQYADENGIRHSVLDDLSRDQAGDIVDAANVMIGNLLYSKVYA